MENIKNELLVFLPVLHPELVVEFLPRPVLAEVRFMSPGLAESVDRAGGCRHYVSPDLVYSPKQAAACLNDLIGFQAAADGLAVAAARRMAAEFWGALSPVENEDLKRFVAGGGRIEPKLPNDDKLRREIHEQAQKNLLLAWSQEENILEIKALLNKLGQASGQLRESLSEPGAVGAFDAGAGVGECGEQPHSTSIEGMVDLIMQESGIAPEDLQVKWAASLLGALCLTPAETCYYTTGFYLEKLLAELSPEESGRPKVTALSPGQAERWAASGHRDWAQRLAQCRIPYPLLLSAYNSPLLKRLLYLEGAVRKEITFIFDNSEQEGK